MRIAERAMEIINEARVRKPKYWNTNFASKVIKAYEKGELKLTDIKGWEIAYNGGIDPGPNMGTREILDYYFQQNGNRPDWY